MLEKLRAPRAVPAEHIRLGTVRPLLASLGYPAVVSALAPYGACVGFPAFPVKLPDHLTSEHPAALPCVANKLALVVVQVIEDDELLQRVGKLLARKKLTAGPCRLGADGARLYVLRAEDIVFAADALEGRVQFLHARRAGPVGEIVSEIVPLDGSWTRSLLETPYESLAPVSAELARALLAEIDALPWKISEERRPPPAPTRAAFLGR